METLGERLRILRERNGWTASHVAKLLGIANSTLSGYEHDYRGPDKEMTLKLAELYGVSTDFLLKGHSGIGQNAYRKRDESNSKLSENNDTMDFQPGTGWNSERSNKVINLALEQMKKTDSIGTPVDIILIPVLGTIKAGYDLYAEQQVIGMEPVAQQAVSDGAEYFFLLVKGDSMIEEGIREGMKVLVRRQNWVDDGKIGVILINGDEATLKRVIHRDNELVLISSNAKYPPRTIPIAEARIQGQVTQVVWDV